ncbi:MAG TPA: hypothetical protein VHU40_21835 [Polyangia bacterium]|nr:hypothetical protein [Polyangia bacterium]
MTLRLAVTWVVGPLVVLALAAGIGHALSRPEQSRLHKATAPLSNTERARLDVAPVMAAANATWAYGSVDAVRTMAHDEIERLGEALTPERARAFLRFAIVDSNPDGQAALLGQACMSDADLCAHLTDAGLRETQARYVSPGNVLPPSMVAGHPR